MAGAQLAPRAPPPGSSKRRPHTHGSARLAHSARLPLPPCHASPAFSASPRHNEIIIGAKPWEAHLPGLIDAVFVAGGGASAAVDTHRRFLAAYGLSDGDCPLVAIDLHEWHSPVSLYAG